MRVICISGHAGAGKDTVAKIMKEKLEQHGQSVLVTHNADLLKHLCRTLFDWDGQKDEAGRSLLQYVGTDVVRKQHPDFWVNFLISIFDLFGENWDYAIIPDCRFPNEIDRLKEAGYRVTHIRVDRDVASTLTEEQRNHPSETAMNTVTPDYIVVNNGTIDDLRHNICVVVAS